MNIVISVLTHINIEVVCYGMEQQNRMFGNKYASARISNKRIGSEVITLSRGAPCELLIGAAA